MTITELIAIIFFLAFAGFLTAAQEIGKAILKAILLDDEGNQVDSDKADDRQIHFTKADKKACQREVITSGTTNTKDTKTEKPA